VNAARHVHEEYRLEVVAMNGVAGDPRPVARRCLSDLRLFEIFRSGRENPRARRRVPASDAENDCRAC